MPNVQFPLITTCTVTPDSHPFLFNALYILRFFRTAICIGLRKIIALIAFIGSNGTANIEDNLRIT